MSALLCIAVCCCLSRCVAMCCSVLQCPAACLSVLQGVAACCSVLQRVAVATEVQSWNTVCGWFAGGRLSRWRGGRQYCLMRGGANLDYCLNWRLQFRLRPSTSPPPQSPTRKPPANSVPTLHLCSNCNTLQHTATRCNTLQHT